MAKAVQTAVIKNPSGIHARPASMFVQCAAAFSSATTVRDLTKDGDAKDAKSILAVMSAGIRCGDEVEIAAEGDDAVQAVAALVELIEAGCGE